VLLGDHQPEQAEGAQLLDEIAGQLAGDVPGAKVFAARAQQVLQGAGDFTQGLLLFPCTGSA
jgi:hypothetical protein